MRTAPTAISRVGMKGSGGSSNWNVLANLSMHVGDVHAWGGGGREFPSPTHVARPLACPVDLYDLIVIAECPRGIPPSQDALHSLQLVSPGATSLLARCA